MNLIVDIGNTQVKLAIFNGSELSSYTSCKPDEALPNIDSLVAEFKPQACIISSVIDNDDFVVQHCSDLFPTILLDDETRLPIRNNYKTPSTLGKDRLACAVGLHGLYPSQNSLSVDFGTCIKFDFIDQHDQYVGGAISPGMQMRFQALNTFTSQLPLIEPKFEIPLAGNTTEESILSGVIHGIWEEVNGVINKYKATHNVTNVVITGGDHKYFEKGLKNITFADPYLVLKGLNEILQFNTKS